MKSNEIKYLCAFEWDDGVVDKIYIPDIQAAKDGFWLNDNFEYSDCDEPVWWIPPARVLYVQRVNITE